MKKSAALSLLVWTTAALCHHESAVNGFGVSPLIVTRGTSTAGGSCSTSCNSHDYRQSSRRRNRSRRRRYPGDNNNYLFGSTTNNRWYGCDRMMTMSSSVAAVGYSTTSSDGIENPAVGFQQTRPEVFGFPTTTTTTTPPEEPRVHFFADPATVEFVEIPTDEDEDNTNNSSSGENDDDESSSSSFSSRPLHASMLQASAPYIAAHAGATVVFHIPTELVERKPYFDNLLEDIALSWLLGMKIVVVVGGGGRKSINSFPEEDEECLLEEEELFKDDDVVQDSSSSSSSSCPVTLGRLAVDFDTLRHVEEEAGYARFEVERKLNRYLRIGGADTGNVVGGGNFYSARRYGIIRGEDLQYAGYVANVNSEGIQHVLDGDDHDIVLLTTLGTSSNGDLVSVEGEHLAATVAASLGARKLIYMSSMGSVLAVRDDTDDDDDEDEEAMNVHNVDDVNAATSTSTTNKTMEKKEEEKQKIILQEIPLSFATDLTEYYGLEVYSKAGFASLDRASRDDLPARAKELLLNLGWASWAVENGARRAHIVNPKDGGLLEELFTSKNGANTCLYHDRELIPYQEPVQDFDSLEWDSFFSKARK